jgi:hypothetical protein
MHIIFIPYGIRQNVEHLFRDMEAQKFPLYYTDHQGQRKLQWIQGNLRILPFGFVEYVCPREFGDMVMATLNFQREEGDRYQLGSARMFVIRKFLKAEKIPEKIDLTRKMQWYKDNVEIIPIGIRHDADMTYDAGEGNVTHEAI